MSKQAKIISISRTASGLDADLDSGAVLRIQACTPHVLRVRLAQHGRFAESGLERYGFITAQWPNVECEVAETARRVTLKTSALELRIQKRGPKLTFARGRNALLSELDAAWGAEEGFGAQFELPSEERFVGFGDQSRERIEHRGQRARMWIRNVSGYTPIPFFMSNRGYGLFVNSTWPHVFDMGATSDEWFGFAGESGQLDYFFINGPDYAAILDRYTDITGKPYIPPLWSFGLWYICHTDANARDMLDDCLRFREKGIPCDVVGLEPGWMEKNYDFSVDKQWHPERFKIPPYCPKGPTNFLDAARCMGFKPMLWLCCDYDLSIEEERRLNDASPPFGVAQDVPAPLPPGEGRTTTAGGTSSPPSLPGKGAEGLGRQILGAFEDDEHLSSQRRMDTQTKPDEPWFDHLKKFVDQGVELFKQDGANQVLEHPDRKWANGMDDEEMHNLYPLFYSRQMHEGFREHTGRRATCFTPSGYAGLQRWTGTWAGDTGGGPKPLVSMLNLSMSGHSLMTCDMDITTKEAVHFGFLQSWAQLNNWNYWRQPWYQGEELQDTFLHYTELRYELIPYLYTMAHIAHRTGMPILRAMPLMFPEDETCYELLNQYMLGDCLLVSAFAEKTYLPAGKWLDYWTGEAHEGPKWVKLDPPEIRGGGLFIRAGAIQPANGTGLVHIDCQPLEDVDFHIAPGADGEALLIEDDGTTYAYEEGHVCETRLTWREEGDVWKLRIEAPTGLVERVPKNRDQHVEVFRCAKPIEVLVDRKALPEEQGWGDHSNWRYEPVYWGHRPLRINVHEDAHQAHEIEIIFGDEKESE